MHASDFSEEDSYATLAGLEVEERCESVAFRPEYTAGSIMLLSTTPSCLLPALSFSATAVVLYYLIPGMVCTWYMVQALTACFFVHVPSSFFL